mgnify:CR=1 FL=1
MYWTKTRYITNLESNGIAHSQENSEGQFSFVRSVRPQAMGPGRYPKGIQCVPQKSYNQKETLLHSPETKLILTKRPSLVLHRKEEKIEAIERSQVYVRHPDNVTPHNFHWRLFGFSRRRMDTINLSLEVRIIGQVFNVLWSHLD